MARLFPLRTETAAPEGQPRVVDLADEDADAVFGALSSTTARQIYAQLSEEPGTPSDVAEAVDSSIQNVRYHLEKLEDAGLIEVVDTWYSSRGNEMSVYATTDGPLIVTSDRSRADQLREALTRFVGGLGVLLGASIYVQYGLERTLAAMGAAASWRPSFGLGADDAEDGAGETFGRDGDDAASGDSTGSGGSDDSADADDGMESSRNLEDEPTTEDASPSVDEAPDGDMLTDQTDTATELGAEATDAIVATLPPGLLFFLGGLVVLVLVTAWWYRSTY